MKFTHKIIRNSNISKTVFVLFINQLLRGNHEESRLVKINRTIFFIYGNNIR